MFEGWSCVVNAYQHAGLCDLWWYHITNTLTIHLLWQDGVFFRTGHCFTHLWVCWYSYIEARGWEWNTVLMYMYSSCICPFTRTHAHTHTHTLIHTVAHSSFHTQSSDSNYTSLTHQLLTQTTRWQLLVCVFCSVICKLRKKDALLLGVSKILESTFLCHFGIVTYITQEVMSWKNKYYPEPDCCIETLLSSSLGAVTQTFLGLISFAWLCLFVKKGCQVFLFGGMILVMCELLHKVVGRSRPPAVHPPLSQWTIPAYVAMYES